MSGFTGFKHGYTKDSFVGLPPANFYDYLYRVTGTRDLPLYDAMVQLANKYFAMDRMLTHQTYDSKLQEINTLIEGYYKGKSTLYQNERGELVPMYDNGPLSELDTTGLGGGLRGRGRGRGRTRGRTGRGRTRGRTRGRGKGRGRGRGRGRRRM